MPGQTEAGVEAAEAANHARRRRQGEVTRRVIDRETRPNSRYVLLGDMNDDPDSPHLAPMLGAGNTRLSDGLIGVNETRPPKAETFQQPPNDGRWTSRHRSEGTTHFRLFDQIWLSPSLAQRASAPMIDRRTKHSGDGSDHDPAWVTLDL